MLNVGFMLLYVGYVGYILNIKFSIKFFLKCLIEDFFPFRSSFTFSSPSIPNPLITHFPTMQSYANHPTIKSSFRAEMN